MRKKKNKTKRMIDLNDEEVVLLLNGILHLNFFLGYQKRSRLITQTENQVDELKKKLLEFFLTNDSQS